MIGSRASTSGFQLNLDVAAVVSPRFPSTRYQGSKTKLAEWIESIVAEISFVSALDLFGGTSCVSYLFKRLGKEVTANDALRSNYLIALGLIENESIVLSEDDVKHVTTEHAGETYGTFIHDTFHDIYFTDEENVWLDRAVRNIGAIDDRYKRAMAFFSLFQACIVKRPFNLFHRKNLNLRTRDVKRSFGNKTSWDTPFDTWFRRFAAEANAAVFDNGKKNRAINVDWRAAPVNYDLVYVDTPYMSSRGVGVDFQEFYHFLEGLSDYRAWPDRVDWRKKHRPIAHKKPPWCDPHTIHAEFDAVFSRFKDSCLVVSYRSNGIPTVDELVEILKRYKSSVVVHRRDYQYVLSPTKGQEVLLVAE